MLLCVNIPVPSVPVSIDAIYMLNKETWDFTIFFV